MSKDIERVQKRCLNLHYLYFSYSEALNKSGQERLDYGHDLMTKTYSEKLRS